MHPSSISNSEFNDSLKFGPGALVFRFSMFLFPMLLAVALIFEVALFQIGEVIPEKFVAAKQHAITGESVYYRGYFSQSVGYKLSALRALRPKIVVVGNSRSMQVRSIMFSPLEDEFYNAGG